MQGGTGAEISGLQTLGSHSFHNFSVPHHVFNFFPHLFQTEVQDCTKANGGAKCMFLTYEHTLCSHMTPFCFGDPDTAGVMHVCLP